MKPIILGHRGSIRFPENTLKALSFALDVGADGVEIDIQRTLDGRFVLSHDENLKRLTGQDINIREKTYNQLKEVRIQGEPLATLEEVLELVRSRSKLVDVEVKNPSDFDPLKELLDQVGWQNMIVSSFWHRGIDTLKQHCKTLPVGYIYSHDPSDLSDYAQKVDYLKPYYEYVRLETYGPYTRKTIPWTVNDIRVLKNLTSMGIYGVITDVPETFVEHFNTKDQDTTKIYASATPSIDPMYLRYLLSMIDSDSLSVDDNKVSFTALNKLLPLHVESVGIRGGTISLSRRPPFLWNMGEPLKFEMTFSTKKPVLDLSIRETGTISLPMEAIIQALRSRKSG